MRRTWRTAALSAAFVLSLDAAQPVGATQRGTSSAGISYVSGGVSIDELDELRAERSKFSYWLTTAAKGSGAYLADAHVRIVDTKTKSLVLDHVMDGPWLFVDLPPGRYEIETTFDEQHNGSGETQKRIVVIRPKDRQQMVLYFTSDATVIKDTAAAEESAGTAKP